MDTDAESMDGRRAYITTASNMPKTNDKKEAAKVRLAISYISVSDLAEADLRPPSRSRTSVSKG